MSDFKIGIVGGHQSGLLEFKGDLENLNLKIDLGDSEASQRLVRSAGISNSMLNRQRRRAKKCSHL